MCYSSHFKDTLTEENQPFFESMEILIFDTNRQLSAIISPFKFTQRHSNEGRLFASEKHRKSARSVRRRVLEANKEQAPLKS